MKSVSSYCDIFSNLIYIYIYIYHAPIFCSCWTLAPFVFWLVVLLPARPQFVLDREPQGRRLYCEQCCFLVHVGKEVKVAQSTSKRGTRYQSISCTAPKVGWKQYTGCNAHVYKSRGKQEAVKAEIHHYLPPNFGCWVCILEYD